jgi:hypothetical protein
LRTNIKLWKVWWIGGAALAAATAALIWATERAYDGGQIALGGLASVARILLYLLWFRAVWRCSRNVGRPLWTHVARGLLVAGLIASALLY